MNTQPMPIRIDFVSDVVCPWCAIGLVSLEQALQRLQGTVLPIRFMVMPNGTDHQAASADSTFLVR